jgi:hypothetical protein
VILAVQLAACTFEPIGAAVTDGGGDVDAGELPDAPPPLPDAAVPPDGSVPDAPPTEPAGHLLLTEVKTQPNDEEFIEIYNPLDVDVSLDDYYLTDDPLYGTLPGATGELPVGGGDALLRFPDGSTLAAGQVAVIALDEEGFEDRFDRDPDYALVSASDPVAVPMVRVADSDRSMDITDTGEPIILFHWDGETDLVTDIDIVLVGNEPPGPGQDNGLPDKSGLMVDGPDADAIESAYAADAAVTPPMSFRASNAVSYQRILPETGHEARGGGNGADGHDETSEETQETWTQEPITPSPGAVATALQ